MHYGWNACNRQFNINMNFNFCQLISISVNRVGLHSYIHFWHCQEFGILGITVQTLIISLEYEWFWQWRQPVSKAFYYQFGVGEAHHWTIGILSILDMTSKLKINAYFCMNITISSSRLRLTITISKLAFSFFVHFFFSCW